jgi:hypothetical protein
VTQPNCYWTLDTPPARVIGLYSNVNGKLAGFLRLIVSGTEARGEYFTAQRPPHHFDRAAVRKDEFQIPLV